MGDTNEQVDGRCAIHTNTKCHIIESLQDFLHQNNELIRLFKTAIEQMPSDDYTVVIKSDKTPAEQHNRHYNAPTIEEVAIVTVGEQF